jgi:hypothetical protein
MRALGQEGVICTDHEYHNLDFDIHMNIHKIYNEHPQQPTPPKELNESHLTP